MKKELIEKPFLVLKVANQTIAIERCGVLNIVDSSSIIPLHFRHNILVGILKINHFNLPIVDVRSRLGIDERNYDIDCGVAIVRFEYQYEFYEVGLLYDSVIDLVAVNKDDLSMNSLGQSNMLSTNPYKGNFQLNGDLVQILDIENLFHKSERALFSEIMNIQNYEFKQGEVEELNMFIVSKSVSRKRKRLVKELI